MKFNVGFYDFSSDTGMNYQLNRLYSTGVMNQEELRYMQRLAELYPTIGIASTEIINLQSILNLPKGTEHFLSDLHGEYDAFSHVLRNGSGAVRKKIDDVFGVKMIQTVRGVGYVIKSEEG